MSFTDVEAVRSQQYLWVNIPGPTGSGKTISAIQVGLGILQVDPGEMFLVDTEDGRGTHYAPKKGEKPDFVKTFPYRYVKFDPPYSPDRYLEAIRYCVSRGAKVVVIDQATYMHDHPEGGVLALHAAKAEELAKKWKTTYGKAATAAWIEVKANLKNAIREMRRQKVHVVWCFRAGEKTDFSGEKPEALGVMPVASKELWYEADISFLLEPGADGYPSFHPEESGAKLAAKCPAWARPWFKDGKRRLDQSVGVDLAKWASAKNGESSPSTSAGTGGSGGGATTRQPNSPTPPTGGTGSSNAPPGSSPSSQKSDTPSEAAAALWGMLKPYGETSVRLAWISKHAKRQVSKLGELSPAELEVLIGIAKEEG